MFRRFQRFYNSIKFGADALMIVVAFAGAYVTRFYSGLNHEAIPLPKDTALFLVMALIVFPITFREAGLYTTNRSRTHIAEIFELFKATVMATLVLVALTYFTRERYSRMTVAIFVTYVFLGVALVRIVLRAGMQEIRRRGYNLKSILVVGAGELGQHVIDTVNDHRELGFWVKGVLTRKAEKVGSTVNGVQVLGLVSDLDRVLNENAVDQVIIALPSDEQPRVKDLMELLALRTVDVKIVPDVYQYMTLRGGLEEFGGLPIISLQGAPLDGWNRVAKRLFDILVSLLAIVMTFPAMLVAGIGTALNGKGPVFFRQLRMGIDGHTFSMLKFRTMRVDAESDGAAMTAVNDPRRTAFGSFLRRTSMDELPQLFNVLKGDMSLVGPRPEQPVFIEEFKRQIPRYHLRHMVKAGMTGWAQINGLRGQTSIQKRIEFDLYYIENWSLWLDLKILLRTALGGFLSKNAY